MQQYDSLSTKAQRKLWFHAGSGTPTNYSGCLEKKKTEDSEIPSEAVDKDYIWEICEDWFKLNILKTRGCYCFIAAVLNSMGISLAEAIAMFDHFALLHNSVGEFDYRQASHRFQQYAKEITSFKGAFVVRKFAALLSVEEFFFIGEEEQNIWIVVYETVKCTTHSIT